MPVSSVEAAVVREAGTDNALLRRVSRSMFWNASMLPVIIVVNLAAGIMIRRGFGLQSGVYDVFPRPTQG